ncbi:PLP-dependent transferase, partial [Ascodesmis nigricans]
MQPPSDAPYWSFDGRPPTLRTMSDSTSSTASSDSSPRAPVNLSRHYNRTTLARKGNPMKSFYKYFTIPGITNLAGGLPYSGYFPFDTLESDAASANRFLQSLHNAPTPTPAASSKSFSLFSRSNNHLTIPKSESNLPLDQRIDVDTTLQYGRASGLASLAEFVKDFTLNHLHQGKIPYADADTLLTCGSTDGMNKVVSLIASNGDNMLCEEFAYNPALNAARPHGVGVVVVDMDKHGLLVDGPNGLREILETWDEDTMGRKPHFLYTVSIGHNPTGSTTELPRMREIYTLCQQHDILIIEDNPYWYLQFTTSSHKSPDNFLASLTPSYLTLDADGRVIRLDTFSKTIAPGCRLGWITAQSDVITRLIALTDASTQAPSGFVQAHLAHLLIRHWGMSGWITWLSTLRAAYESRMRTMTTILHDNAHYISSAAQRSTVHVSKIKMLEFRPPAGGMFVWVRIKIRNHPVYKAFRRAGWSREEMVRKLWLYVAMRKLVLVAPGEMFRPDETVDAVEYWRLCFAAVEEGEVERATRRLCEGVEEFWGLGVGEIEAITEDGVEGMVGGGEGRV